MLAEVVHGLSASPRQLPPKFFYDERGSILYERATEQEEYYLTRSELKIMQLHATAIKALIGPRVCLIEYGSGSSLKTRVLLDELEELAAYIPIDISKDFIATTVQDLRKCYPHISIKPLVADFTRDINDDLTELIDDGYLRKVIYCPGSTIGNYEPQDAIQILRQMRQQAGPNGYLLIGIDMVKDQAVLEEAYNDRKGVTEQFNLNMLHHINSVLGDIFTPSQFEHSAVYDPIKQRIVLKLVSKVPQTVNVDSHSFEFSARDEITTEYSHKYTVESFTEMCRQSGLQKLERWTDPKNWFSVWLLRSL